MTWRRILIAAFVLSVTVLGQGGVVAQGRPSDEEFLRRVSKDQDIPMERLQIGDRITQDYPLTGSRLHAAKMLDKTNGNTYLVALDAQGNDRNLAATEAAERSAKRNKYGKLNPRLHDKLTKTRPNQAVPVSIWLNVPDPPNDRSRSVGAHLQAVQQHMAAQRQGVVNAIEELNSRARTPEYAPVVFATLNRGQIQAIAQREDVDAIYAPTEYTLFGDDAATTERGYRLWVAGNLGAGQSSRPVVHEPDGVSDGNPNLDNATHPVIFWCSNVNTRCPNGKHLEFPGAGPHASMVGGVIASTNPLVRGIAPNAQVIFSANSQDFNDANLVDAFEWARGNSGDPTNMSWGQTCPDGQQNFMSRYVDWAARNLAATFTISSGNTRGCASRDLEVSAPGVAWSVITVGSFEDDNNGFWSGDSMSGFSRYQNPGFATGMEKPEVVAVGEDRRTTDLSGITSSGVDGTSFAAPAVAGQVVSMLARRPGQNMWPETNKAAVLASAYHDITSGRNQDGVGAVVMNNSDDTYRLNRFQNDFFALNDAPHEYVRALTANQRVRVAIAWDSNSSGGNGTDTLGADLDLCVIRNDTGATIACSVSVQNAWELVEFTAPVSTNYTFRVSQFSAESGWPGSFLGMAYSIRSLPDICTGISSGTGTVSVNTANGPTFFDSYAGWSFNQSGREYVRRFVLSSTRDINVSDNNANLDLHVVQMSCTANPITPTIRGQGGNSVFINNAAAGTYYLIVDGRAGAVGTSNVTISLTGP